MNNPEFLINNLCTNGFYIIDDFLKEEQCTSLRTTVQGQYAQGLFRGAKIGLNINQHEDTTIRKDEILWLNGDETNLELRVFLAKINQLAGLLNQSIFLGLHEIEAHFASYQPGTYYKKHCDQFSNQKTRKITFVYYLNKNWKHEYGGSLNLYNTENQLIHKVVPLENRFICFNSELPHEVALTHKPRYSITGWMKTRPV